MASSSIVTLNDGNHMPVLGLGVYLAENGGEAKKAILFALQQGYRLIDTAKIYG